MSQIRKKSLKSSIWIYAGFVIGAINTYFLTHKAWFSTDENGLTRVMLEVGLLLYSFSTLGITSFLYKFFPYYEDNLSPKKNDILTVSLIVAFCGFAITTTCALLFEPVIIRKFSTNSLLLVQYFYWSLPMAFLMLIYGILEAYSYGFNKGVFTGILRETVLRLYTSVIILLKIFDLISFKTFIQLFSFQYGVIIIILLINLYLEKRLWLAFSISRVTKKFRKKIFAMLALTVIVVVVGALRQTIDGLVLASKQNLGKAAIFGLAAYMVSVLQVPLRSIIAITIPVLSRAWKNKQLEEIDRIYKRSSINLLSFALFAFFCIWLNFTQAINFFGIHPDYLEGRWVFFLLGMVTIIEMGTGVNAQIIGTSTYWRFELWTSLLLTALIIPLSYFLTVKYAILGPAIANIISFTVYNAVRYVFLWKKFNMQPFSLKTIEVIAISAIDYLLCYLLFGKMEGIAGMVLRTVLFAGIFIVTFYWRNISPDLKPIAANLLQRLKIKNIKP
ncbi:lipopolysaccharide biosynthesis protein [Ferruginibacter sp.]|nr:lipopolysaccharide biosynthesis protein [Ferruginibacter sp.]